jgi:hypothetical protein
MRLRAARPLRTEPSARVGGVSVEDVLAEEFGLPVFGGDDLDADGEAVVGWRVAPMREGCLGQRLKGEALSIGTDFLADDEGADRVAVLVGAKVERFELEAGQRALGLVVAFLDGDGLDGVAGDLDEHVNVGEAGVWLVSALCPAV